MVSASAGKLGELPADYDHKYTYSHLGYNLKPLDPQAAIGRVQLRRLPEFIEARKLDRHQSGTRMLGGGNLLRQPAFVQLRQDRPEALRVVGEDDWF